MSTTSARRVQPAAAAPTTRPTLRVYDPRLSDLLKATPEPSPETLAQINLAGWVAGTTPLVARGGNLSPIYVVLKRTVDVCGALSALALLSPLMLVVWLALYVTTKGSPIFRQQRVGRCGRRFDIFKFRTMRLDALEQQGAVVNEQAGPVFKNRRDPRITRLGHWLRRLSLDETPQLFNVLRGEMSLVGPRPPIPREVAQYQQHHCLRLSVTPGLTCLWQVSGRSEIEFDDWMRLDWWYVQNQSLRTDLSLLLRTPWSVLSCRGAY